jgi:tetratricopeptide (TPR) repeat protein
MKAQRRHELKTNTLAQQLERLPFTLREHGGKILLAVIAVLLIIVLVNFRARATREGDLTAAQDLSGARSLIGELSGMSMSRVRPDDVASQVSESLDSVMRMADDANLKAEALIARGDLNWTLANLNDLSADNPSTTQPSSEGEETSRAERLEAAADAYQRVLSEYPDQTLSVASARFGLAAIAEDRADWDAAKEHYEAIQSNEKIAEAFHALAKLREERLADIRRPILIASPATQPAATQPADDLIIPPTTEPEVESTTAPVGE